MKKNVISILEIVTLFTLLLAPLSLLAVNQELLFPYITSKNFAWRMCIDIALVSWASLALLDVRYRINIQHPLFLSLAGFMVIMLASNLLSDDPFRAFWSNAERMDGYVGLLHMCAFFVSAWGFIQAQKQKASHVANVLWLVMFGICAAQVYPLISSQVGREHSAWWMLSALVAALIMFGPAWHKPNFTKSFVHGLLALGAFMGIIAIGQEKARADALLGNPIYLASYVSFCIFACVYYLTAAEHIFNRKYLKEILYVLAIVFFLLVIFETATRGAILGLMFGGFTTALLIAMTAREPQEKNWRIVSGIGLVSFVLVTALFFGMKDHISQSQIAPNHLLKRAANFSLEDTTTKHRLANWDMAIDGWKERPLTGWGQEHYIDVFSTHYQPAKLHNAEQWFDRTHNMFLDWLVFGGVFGLLSFIAILYMAVWCIWKRGNSQVSTIHRSVLTGVIVAYAAQNFVSFDALATGLWFMTFLLMITLLSDETQEEKQHIEINAAPSWMLIVLMWVAMLWWIWYSILLPKHTIDGFMTMLRGPAVGESVEQAMQNRLDPLSQSLQTPHIFQQEFIEQLLSRPQLYTQESMSPELRRSYIELVSTEAVSYMDQHPQKTRIPHFYATFLSKFGTHERAQEYYLRALETSPNKLGILQALSVNALHLGQQEEALSYAKQIIGLAPESSQYQEFYRQVSGQAQTTQ